MNQILSSHILKNLKIFTMKSNIGITTFLGIQIVRIHIPKNLNTKNNGGFPCTKCHLK